MAAELLYYCCSCCDFCFKDFAISYLSFEFWEVKRFLSHAFIRVYILINVLVLIQRSWARCFFSELLLFCLSVFFLFVTYRSEQYSITYCIYKVLVEFFPVLYFCSTKTNSSKMEVVYPPNVLSHLYWRNTVYEKRLNFLGTDEKTITRILGSRSNAQRQRIKIEFATLFGKVWLYFICSIFSTCIHFLVF